MSGNRMTVENARLTNVLRRFLIVFAITEIIVFSIVYTFFSPERNLVYDAFATLGISLPITISITFSGIVIWNFFYFKKRRRKGIVEIRYK